MRAARIYADSTLSQRWTRRHQSCGSSSVGICGALDEEFVFKDAIGVDAADRILDALRAAGADGMTQTVSSRILSNRNLAAPLLARAPGNA